MPSYIFFWFASKDLKLKYTEVYLYIYKYIYKLRYYLLYFNTGLNLSSCSPVTTALNKTDLKDASSSLETTKDETKFHFDIDVKLFPNTQF